MKCDSDRAREGFGGLRLSRTHRGPALNAVVCLREQADPSEPCQAPLSLESETETDTQTETEKRKRTHAMQTEPRTRDVNGERVVGGARSRESKVGGRAAEVSAAV